MRPKEVYKKLDIKPDRIKLFKREGIFSPENPPSGNHSTDYTENDYKELQRLVVLTKCGLTCSDIKKMQEEKLTLSETIIARQKAIDEEIDRKRNSLQLLSQMLDEKAEFKTFETKHFWDIIQQREAAGDEFINFEDLYGYESVPFTRVIKCPYCQEESEIDFEDYLYDESSYEKENGMGPDMVYSFDSEGNYECPFCCKKLRISGWIREYPMGAYDSEDIVIEPIEVEEDNEDE